MTTLDEIVLIDVQPYFDSGGAFRLSHASKSDLLVELDNDWEVEVRTNSQYIVARGKSIKKENVFSESLVRVQQALDLIFAKSNILLATAINCQDDYIIWWKKGIKQYLRIAAHSDLTGTFSGKISVNNGKNNSIRISEKYKESFRFLRLAKLSYDSFDEYRNLYLALENYVAELSAENINIELEWLKKVIENNCNNYIEEDVEKIYTMRCSIFHGKNFPRKKSRFLLNKKDEQEVQEALNILKETLRKLYNENLGYSIHNFSQTSGIRISKNLFQSLLSIHKDYILRTVNSGSFDINNPDISLINKLSTNTKYHPIFTETNTPALFATHELDTITQPLQINGVIAVQNNEKLTMHQNLEGTLDINSVDILEILWKLSAQTIN